MGQIQLRHMRIWMVVITTFNLVGMLAYYGYLAYDIERRKRNGYYDYYSSESPNLLWGDWATIITAIGYFIFYIFALRGTGFQQIHKYLRAFLVLAPNIVMLYLTCNVIHITLLNYDMSYGNGGYYDVPGPFDCRPSDNYLCFLSYTNLFMSLITALFVVIEIGMTLAWGPLVKAHQFGGARGGYAPDANVVLVSPDQPYLHQQQHYYYPQQPQQQFQQQGYLPQMQQLPPQQPILGTHVTQQPQQQGPDSQLAYLPYSPSAHTQSPFAATATSGYQPSPQPSQPSVTEHQPSSSPYTPAH
ncbi:hypothetical protein BGZ97_003344 [Linnemannia gamsii]|jgi:hypothetical protein|uniref:Uncharacterized protein n=1 Tax=Linnemannia gamsii TaxID=64522 RepID=A0A9P6UHT5_9FUNG|nr:hypothetical protein BGZ97_003344 [Linnemannia gamsii]